MPVTDDEAPHILLALQILPASTLPAHNHGDPLTELFIPPERMNNLEWQLPEFCNTLWGSTSSSRKRR